MAFHAADHARLSELPTANGGITRAALERAAQEGVDTDSLLKRARVPAWQANDQTARISVPKQIALLNLAAEALGDPSLGIRLAQGLDLRELGLLYYVPASSATIEEALQRLARYSAIHNEGVQLTCSTGRELCIKMEYVGIARLS